MKKYAFTLPVVTFVIIWSFWSIWTSFEPLYTSSQLAALFIFVPISALLLAFYFLYDKDDDDFQDKEMQTL
tara:strand:+ start:10 stop:222 length:213 start_codon:yes stop_codon:yes gene_type:complete